MNSFNTLLLTHLDRGDPDAHFENKKVVQSDDTKILRLPFILTHWTLQLNINEISH